MKIQLASGGVKSLFSQKNRRATKTGGVKKEINDRSNLAVSV